MREAVYRFGDVEVEPGGRELRRGGARVPLEPKALDVLLVLLGEAGRVVDKRRLLAEVWPDVHVTDSSLARAVTQIRRALGDDIKSPRYIETVPTRGYRFIGVLRAPDEAVSVEPSRQSAPKTSTGEPGTIWRQARAVGTVALICVVLLVGARLAWRGAVSQAASADPGPLMLAAVAQGAVQVTTSRGLDAHPALSPDGTAVAYASDASGALEIYVLNRVARDAAQTVTDNGGDNVDPAWSPDGQWLAYHSRRFGGIWLVPAAGGPARQLVDDGAAPSWASDGRTLVFQTSGEADILGGPGGSPSTLSVVDVASGQVEALTRRGHVPGSHGSPVWLPGHDTVVFTSMQVPAAEVWQVTRDGRASRLGTCLATCRPFAFRREGTTWVGALRMTRVASTWWTRGKAQELWMAPVTGAGQVDMSRARATSLPRTLGVTDVSVSRDGTQLAFSNAERTSEARSISLPNGAVDQAGPPVVLLGERRPRYGEFAVSPEGTRLAYTTSRLGDRPAPWLHDLRTGASRQLGTAVTGFVKGWAPDSQALAVVSEDDPLAVQRVDVLTGRTTPLLRLDSWARVADAPRRLFTLRLSRDFRRYFYTSDEGGRPGVWMADVTGDAPPVPVASEAMFGAWSSDGRQIALQQLRGWRSDVAVTSPGQGVVRRLVSDADLAWPNDWSPDGRHIVYAALRHGRWALETVDATTGRVRQITAPGAPTEYVRWPVWSPRGDRIVYERGYWTGNVWVAAVPET